MIPLAMRPTLEFLRRLSTTYTQPGRAESWPTDSTSAGADSEHYFDFDNRATALRDQSKFTKRSKRERALNTIDTVVVHQTAVEFGVSNRALKRWAKRILDEDPLIAKQFAAFFDGGDLRRTARRIALHERFWDTVPYHGVSLLIGDAVLNQPFEWRTYHGNAGNSGLGWAQEGLFPFVESRRTPRHTALDEFTIETGRASFRALVSTARAEGAPLEYVQPHRCYSRARYGDTGEGIWRELLLPLFGELHLRADYELKMGGRQIPREWDDAALYDAQGRRIKSTAKENT